MATTKLVERLLVWNPNGLPGTEPFNVYCEGMSHPIAEFLLSRGYRVQGTNKGPGLSSMVEIEDRTLPEQEPPGFGVPSR